MLGHKKDLHLIWNKNEIELLSDKKYWYKCSESRRKQRQQQRQTTYIPIWAFGSSKLQITVIINLTIIINDGKFNFLICFSNQIEYDFFKMINFSKFFFSKKNTKLAENVLLICDW